MSYADRREYMRQYQREWVARRRAAFFIDKFCAECGATEGLELDHIDPTTKVTNSIWSWSALRQAEEIAKCQILCKGCHSKKTVEVDLPKIRGYDPHAHGCARYKGGCRCAICREAVKLDRRRYARNTNRL